MLCLIPLHGVNSQCHIRADIRTAGFSLVSVTFKNFAETVCIFFFRRVSKNGQFEDIVPQMWPKKSVCFQPPEGNDDAAQKD